MATYSYVNLELPEAGRYFDLTGIAFDLGQSKDYCEKYVHLMARIASPEPVPERDFLECISTLAIVKYGRCFKGGVRRKTEKELSQNIPKDKIEFHQHVLDVRDKHIAHSVNEFERCRVRVWLNPEEKGRKVNNVNIELHGLIAPGPEFFARLSQLIDMHLAWIKAEKKQESAKLKELVEERFSLEELYSLRPEAPPPLEMHRAGKKRKWP